MSPSRAAAPRGGAGWAPRPAGGESPDARRALQLVLAGLWLLDGVLQYQPFMYTKGFTQMLAGTADGNPAVIARPITWDADPGRAPPGAAQHASSRRSSCCSGWASRSGRRSGSRSPPRSLWSLGVWWFGEGLGGVLNGAASPLNGAPGAVIIYALLAVLLWPADRADAGRPFTAARAVGAHVARALWLVLWLSLAYFALTPANRAPQGGERHDRGHGERRAGLAGRPRQGRGRRSSPARGWPPRSCWRSRSW